MMTEILANLLAGLGLFFIGVKFVTGHTREMTGRRFRALVARLTQNPWLASVWGVIAGAVMQSTTAVTFIVMSLISAGLISVRRAMPIVAWSNVGNSALVMLTVLDIRLLALYLLGVTGIAYYFNLDHSTRWRHFVGGLLGIGLLFLGLIHMKAGAHPLKEVGWFTAFLAYTRTSYLIAFVAGGFLSFVAQSSTTVSVVAISMAKVGLLGWEQTTMIVYGANVGSGLSTTFMASNVRGVARQLAWFQGVFKLAGALVLVPLFYVEVLAGAPLIHTLMERFAADVGRQMAFIFLLYQLVSALVVLLFSTVILRLVERLSPATQEEVLARPQFIYDQALEEPETALELVAREQLRMARHLPDYLDTVREETRASAKLTPDRLHHAVGAVLKQVDSFTTDLLDQGHSRGSLERAVRLKNRNQQLLALDESLLALVQLVPDSRRAPALQTLAGRMTEALHTVLLTAVDALETPDEFNRETLQTLTADRGELMERIRKAMLGGDHGLGADDQQTLFALTSLFERVIWLLRRLGATLEPAGGATPKAATA